MRDIIIKFLGELERAEARLLGWALVEGYFTKDELEGRAEDFIERENAWNVFGAASELLSEMEQICDHVAILDKGDCLIQGTLEEVKGTKSLEDAFYDLVKGAELVLQMGVATDVDGCHDIIQNGKAWFKTKNLDAFIKLLS